MAKGLEPRNAFLLALTGPNAGLRFPIKDRVMRVGRSDDNDLVPSGERAVSVSGHHLKITREGHSFRLHDSDSTNGTFLNDHPVQTAILEPGAVIMLGQTGPRYRFVVEEPVETPEAEETLVVPRAKKVKRSERSKIHRRDEADLNAAIDRARHARGTGGNETVVIMREVLEKAIRRSRRKHKIAIAVLAMSLVLVTGYFTQRIARMGEKKVDLDQRISRIEDILATAENPEELKGLITTLEDYQRRAHEIQRNLLYQIGHRSAEEDFIDAEIRRIMKEFGAPGYSIPPEFSERVVANIEKYQKSNRVGIQKALGASRDDLEAIRATLKAQNLPPDLAYMVLVESTFQYDARSHAGAAGPWQFVPGTARAYGLKVTRTVDERFDIHKSTQAAARYMRHLILEFGSGNGVILALAAYNLGPTRVKRAIRKVDDPIRQRDFWYLYRVRALPRETREYVPKIIAAIIIGRNPEQFGFVV